MITYKISNSILRGRALPALPELGGNRISRTLRRTSAAVFAVLAGSAFGQGVITQTEQDDSFGTANPTGLTAGSSGIKVAYGHTSDGDYGVSGNFTGDFDFFKLAANAGQVISVDLKNNAPNDDFDSF